MAIPHVHEARIEAVFGPAEAVASVDAAFRLCGHGLLDNPTRTETLRREDGAEVLRLEMPASWPGRYRGRKVIVERAAAGPGTLGARRARVELEDLTTGERVTFDADHLTDLRTGAAGALGLRYLATTPPRTVAVIGTGRVARAVARCLDTALDPGPKHILVTGRSLQGRQDFLAAIAPLVSTEVVSCDDVEACLVRADAVVTAVRGAAPVLRGAEVGDHLPLSVIAGDPRTVQVDVDLLCRRPVVVDHQAQALRSGDFVAVARDRRLDAVAWMRRPDGGVAHIGDAACGRLSVGDHRAPLAYFTGLGALDLHAAVTVWEALGHASPAPRGQGPA